MDEKPRSTGPDFRSLEFVGCLVVLGGGVVLGSMALGIDVKQLAQGAIEKSQLIDPSIFGWESPSQDKRDDTPSAEVEDRCS